MDADIQAALAGDGIGVGRVGLANKVERLGLLAEDGALDVALYEVEIEAAVTLLNLIGLSLDKICVLFIVGRGVNLRVGVYSRYFFCEFKTPLARAFIAILFVINPTDNLVALSRTATGVIP